MIAWEIEGELARAARPGYGLEDDIKVSDIKVWVNYVKREWGIKSIICLLCNEHLKLYPIPLINFYKVHGLKAEHIKMKDNELPTLRQLEKIYESFCSLPKPVLIHCSAGTVRSYLTTCYIRYKRMPSEENFENIVYGCANR